MTGSLGVGPRSTRSALPRIVVAVIVSPLLPICLLILSTAQVLPVVALAAWYPIALAVGIPLYVLMRLAKKTQLRQFLLYAFLAFGLLTFASTVQSYWAMDSVTADGIDLVADGVLTTAGWLRSIYLGFLVGAHAALGGASFWALAHWRAFDRVAGNPAAALPMLVLYAAASLLAARAIDWSGYVPPDLGCHTPGYGGPVRRPTFDLRISETEWPQLRAIFERVAADFGLSYRDTSETRPGVVNLLYLSMCRENGLQVGVNEQRWVRRSELDIPGPDRGVSVFIRAADDDQEWRDVAEELLLSFEGLWGSNVRFRDGSSNLIPRPADPFAED